MKSNRRVVPQEKNIYFLDNISAIREYVKFKPDAIVRIGYKERMQAEVLKLLEGTAVPSVVVPDKSEKKQFDYPATKIWAEVRIDLLPEESLLSQSNQQESPELTLALDHITDPHNVGAIARTAAFMGIKNIIVPGRRQVLLSPASIAASQGAFSLTNLILVPNLHRVLEKLKEHDYWIVGADLSGENINTHNNSFERTVLVLGSEGSGLSRLIKKTCDKLVKIQGAQRSVESLNVSVAAGILIHHHQKKYGI